MIDSLPIFPSLIFFKTVKYRKYLAKGTPAHGGGQLYYNLIMLKKIQSGSLETQKVNRKRCKHTMDFLEEIEVLLVRTEAMFVYLAATLSQTAGTQETSWHVWEVTDWQMLTAGPCANMHFEDSVSQCHRLVLRLLVKSDILQLYFSRILTQEKLN